MEILIFIGGVILGIIFMILYYCLRITYGVIYVDDTTKMCKIHIEESDLTDRTIKRALFIIKHDANISQEKQSL